VTKVLYVEHNDDNLYMLKTRLELRGGFEVLAAEDSAAGSLRGSVSKNRKNTNQFKYATRRTMEHSQSNPYDDVRPYHAAPNVSRTKRK
jgi:CheY-like chemotaxis protein